MYPLQNMSHYTSTYLIFMQAAFRYMSQDIKLVDDMTSFWMKQTSVLFKHKI
jgi:hypothetical protein